MLRTILVADDSPTIRKIVELTFADSDLRVESVASGGDALARLQTLRPDVVLADVVMPEPAGYELCRAIKASDRPVPVVLLAGTFEPFDPELARQCGADGHLIKPFESNVLRERVRRLLEPQAAPPDAAIPDEEESPAERLAVEQALDELEQAAAPVGPAPATDVPEPEVAPPPGAEPSAELVDAVARAVVQRLSHDVLREVAWEVVPKLATEIIRERIRELEREDED